MKNAPVSMNGSGSRRSGKCDFGGWYKELGLGAYYAQTKRHNACRTLNGGGRMPATNSLRFAWGASVLAYGKPRLEEMIR